MAAAAVNCTWVSRSVSVSRMAVLCFWCDFKTRLYMPDAL
jgi:hypothetical protein